MVGAEEAKGVDAGALGLKIVICEPGGGCGDGVTGGGEDGVGFSSGEEDRGCQRRQIKIEPIDSGELDLLSDKSWRISGRRRGDAESGCCGCCTGRDAP